MALRWAPRGPVVVIAAVAAVAAIVAIVAIAAIAIIVAIVVIIALATSLPQQQAFPRRAAGVVAQPR